MFGLLSIKPIDTVRLGDILTIYYVKQCSHNFSHLGIFDAGLLELGRMRNQLFRLSHSEI